MFAILLAEQGVHLIRVPDEFQPLWVDLNMTGCIVAVSVDTFVLLGVGGIIGLVLSSSSRGASEAALTTTLHAYSHHPLLVGGPLFLEFLYLPLLLGQLLILWKHTVHLDVGLLAVQGVREDGGLWMLGSSQERQKVCLGVLGLGQT